jgi:hypothetical protein
VHRAHRLLGATLLLALDLTQRFCRVPALLCLALLHLTLELLLPHVTVIVIVIIVVIVVVIVVVTVTVIVAVLVLHVLVLLVVVVPVELVKHISVPLALAILTGIENASLLLGHVLRLVVDAKVAVAASTATTAVISRLLPTRVATLLFLHATTATTINAS